MPLCFTAQTARTIITTSKKRIEDRKKIILIPNRTKTQKLNMKEEDDDEHATACNRRKS